MDEDRVSTQAATDAAAAGGAASQQGDADDEDVEEVLIEDLSIDGMCGVY